MEKVKKRVMMSIQRTREKDGKSDKGKTPLLVPVNVQSHGRQSRTLFPMVSNF